MPPNMECLYGSGMRHHNYGLGYMLHLLGTWTVRDTLPGPQEYVRPLPAKRKRRCWGGNLRTLGVWGKQFAWDLAGQPFRDEGVTELELPSMNWTPTVCKTMAQNLQQYEPKKAMIFYTFRLR